MGTFLLILLVAWGGVMALWLLFTRAAKSADVDKIKNRLVGVPKAKAAAKKAGEPQLIQRDQAMGLVVQRLMQKYQLQQKVHDLLEQAGLKWQPARFIHTCLGLFLGGFGASWVMLPSNLRILCWVVAVAAGAGPVLFAMQKRGARLKRFEELFPDALEFVSRSMRAGHAFSVSLEMIHREFQEPIAGEFRRTFEEHNLGLPLDFALQKLAKRVPLLDCHFFVSAVLLQKRTGGNLAEILDKLAYVIRERFKLRGRIRAVSAHGKMTGYALTAIPMAVAVLMFFVNPEYVTFFFTDEVGNLMAGAAVGLQLIGYAVIKKIVNIEV
ncbi:MAG: type II secretion system F family protein [Bryobacteraceae bacterium]|nr:type II secretion system F family protein [Bryobacteraceae bacterium]